MLRALLCVCLSALLLVPAECWAGSPRIHAHAGAELEQITGRDDRLRLRVEGIALEFLLQPNEALLHGLGNDRSQRLHAEGYRFWEGEIDRLEGSWVRLSEVDGRYSGAWFDGTELFLLDPAEEVADLLLETAKGPHVLYRLSDLELPPFGDDAIEPKAFAPRAASVGKRMDYRSFADHLGQALGEQAEPRNLVRQLNLTLVTDTQFSTVHGANRDAVVATRMNVVDGIYSGQFQTRIGIAQLRHLTDNANMTATSGSTLLGEFRTFMTTGAGSSIPKGGLNHLLSGRGFDGNIAGVAYVSVLCSANSGYGVNRMPNNNNTWSLVVAHEMGHNFGARHDGQSGSPCESQSGNWLMSPSINGSSTFSPCARDIIQPRINVATCFVPIQVDPRIFRNGFEAG
ncbi:MAG: zinc-dependent metalloprotease [Aquimonas sp.]|nr:zinc-dependent metalloprotease [Aquimonas sp.]